jgi:hypothetical protein
MPSTGCSTSSSGARRHADAHTAGAGSHAGAAPRLAAVVVAEVAGVVVRDALAELRIPVGRANAQHGIDAHAGTWWRGSVLDRNAAAKDWIPLIAQCAQDVVDTARVE